MATATKELPRDLQSKLHDIADEAGERVAMGDIVEVEYELPELGHPMQRCICGRFSKMLPDGSVKFWNRQDENCQYSHVTPLPAPFVITPAS